MNDLSMYFSLNKLPYKNGEIIPTDWKKRKLDLGAVQDEKDNTNFVYYIDELFNVIEPEEPEEP